MAHRPISLIRYLCVFAALLVLTGITIAISFIDLGAWHTPLGLAIAVAKGTLVALFFMDLIESDRMPSIALAAGLFWLAILVGLILAEYFTRRWLAY